MQQHYIVSLSAQERQELSQSLRCGQGLARSQTKARILLLADRSLGEARTDEQVAQAVLCHPLTVLRTRRRFVDSGVQAALHDKERPGAKPKITGEVEAHLVHLACSAPPEGRTAWTLQLLADQLVELNLVESIGATQVGVRLKKTRSSRGRLSRGVCPNRAPIS